VWPGTNPGLEAALENFRRVAQDLQPFYAERANATFSQDLASRPKGSTCPTTGHSTDGQVRRGTPCPPRSRHRHAASGDPSSGTDLATGADNRDIDWQFQVGDRIKLRLINEMDSDHPMHHPFHVHGAGRFLILARDGKPEQNLVWKDTTLITTGETVDLLLDITNPGRWMAHCHIAEHHESGMMLSFEVRST
jgi:FtsP/CotA-like multicopper oxidase with cupredoxin domain